MGQAKQKWEATRNKIRPTAGALLYLPPGACSRGCLRERNTHRRTGAQCSPERERETNLAVQTGAWLNSLAEGRTFGKPDSLAPHSGAPWLVNRFATFQAQTKHQRKPLGA